MRNSRKSRNSIIQIAVEMMFILLFSGVISGAETQYPAEWKIQYVTRNLCYVGSDEVVTVPNSITELDTYAFYGNSSAKVIIIPATVKMIKDFSIYNVPNLRTVIIYGNPKLTEYSIYGCTKLRNIAVQKMGTYAYSFAERKSIPVKIGINIGFPKNSVFLLKGDSCRQVLCNTKTDQILWKSSKNKVATVDASGKVKAKKPGKTVITAITKEGKFSYTVRVYKKTVSNRVKQIKKGESIKIKSNFEKIKAVHNWMIRNIRYDYKNYLRRRIPRSAYTVKGALLKKICVCQGYAVAFKKLMGSYHIPCKVVHGRAGGGGHAWNMVKLGGKWYHVDVTWDDPIIGESNGNTDIYYTYFLKSTAYMRAHNHSFKTGSYPKCSSTKYDKITSF